MKPTSVVVTTAATDEPVSLEEAKAYLRVLHSDDDDVISAMIVAAREHCETVTKRHFVRKTIRYTMDEWPDGDVLEMPRPFASTTASPVVTYFAEGSTSGTTLAATTYWVDADSEPGRIVLRNEQEWPTTVLRSANAVQVSLRTGYGQAGDVPDSVRIAMLMMISGWYYNREAFAVGTIVSSIGYTVDALLAPHTVHHVG